MRTKDRIKIERYKSKKKSQIISAAREVFSKKGYAGANIEDISQKAKIAKGSIYMYFKSKKELFLSVVDSGINELKDTVLTEIEKEKGPLEKIKKAIVAYLRYFEKNSNLIGIMIHEQSQFQNVVQKKYYQRYYEHINKAEEIFKEGMGKAIIKSFNPKDAIGILTNMLNGLIYMWLMEGKKYSLVNLAPLIVKIFFTGIVKDEKTRKKYE